MKLIINLYAGPGTGKSTTAAHLFAQFKQNGYNAEMIREYVKEWVWEERNIKLGDQPYFFAKQARKESLYMDKGIEVIITDSPLLLCHYYGRKHDNLERALHTTLHMLKQQNELRRLHGYTTMDVFLKRVKPYNPEGRFQTEDQAKECDKEIKQLLKDQKIPFIEYLGSENVAYSIYKKAVEDCGL